MKTQVTQQNRANTENSSRSNQASTESILQAYKTANADHSVAQLAEYDGTFTIQDEIEQADLNNWNTVRTKLGNIPKGDKADSSIGSGANNSLSAFGIKSGNAMSAHMIPNRLGGAGDESNVRPWSQTFEDGTWKTDVEDAFDNELVGKGVGEEVSYSVETTEMDEDYFDQLKTQSPAEDVVKNNANHKTKIQAIPVEVSATIGAQSLAATSEPIDDLIA